jgi:hypothetical protein
VLMIRPLPLGLAALCLGIFALGCSSTRTLEGTWVQDGSVPQTMTVTGSDYKGTANVMGSSITITGKLAYDDKALTAKVTDMKLDAPGIPAAMLAQAQGSMPKEMEIDVSWKNNDEIVMTPKGQAMPAGATGTFKRQK